MALDERFDFHKARRSSIGPRRVTASAPQALAYCNADGRQTLAGGRQSMRHQNSLRTGRVNFFHRIALNMKLLIRE